MTQEETKQPQGEQKLDSEEAYNNTIKEILDATDYETNTRAETQEKITEETPDTEEDKNNDKKPLEKGQVEKETEDKNEEILGKTSKEIEEIINQRTQEAVKKHEDNLKDSYEAEKEDITNTVKLSQIEQVLKDYELSIQQIDEMFSRNELTPQQYKNAINQAVLDINELKQKQSSLQERNRQNNIPKIKRVNNEYYKKIQVEIPELKDPIVKKYAESLKEKIYDAGGIDMAKGGFVSYVKDFIASAVTEAEIRGYQKIKNELEKDNAKAKAKTAIPSGDSVQSRNSIFTAEDIENASKEDWLKYVLN